MIADKILDVFIWVYQKTFLIFFPIEYAGLPIETFKDNLSTASDLLAPAYLAINQLAPAWYLFIVLGIMILAEIGLLFAKGVIMIVNIFRGSGA